MVVIYNGKDSQHLFGDAGLLPVQCDAINGNLGTDTWKQRCSFPVYVIAISATVGALRAHEPGRRQFPHQSMLSCIIL